MSRKDPSEALTCTSLDRKTSSQKLGRPMGQRRREKPRLVVGMSDGRGDWDVSASSGIKRRDLLLLRGRAIPLHNEKSSSKILRRAHQCAIIKIPGIQCESRKLTLIFSMRRWRIKAKPSGPKGSPCCTPQQLRIESLPRRNG